MTESLIATVLGLYLALTLPPVIVAWRRGRPAKEIRKAFLYSVLLGWTVIGFLAGWIVALESDAPAFRIEGRVDVSCHGDGGEGKFTANSRPTESVREPDGAPQPVPAGRRAVNVKLSAGKRGSLRNDMYAPQNGRGVKKWTW